MSWSKVNTSFDTPEEKKQLNMVMKRSKQT